MGILFIVHYGSLPASYPVKIVAHLFTGKMHEVVVVVVIGCRYHDEVEVSSQPQILFG
jgi:hypothetical protein